MRAFVDEHRLGLHRSKYNHNCYLCGDERRRREEEDSRNAVFPVDEPFTVVSPTLSELFNAPDSPSIDTPSDSFGGGDDFGGGGGGGDW